MRISIVVPTITDFYFTPRRHTSLGVRLLVELLEKRGHQVSLFDFPAKARRPRVVPIPEPLDYLHTFVDPHEIGPVAFFGRYLRLGVCPAVAARRVIASAPDAVLLSCFAFAYAEDTIAVAAELRDQDPTIPIIVGGAGITVHPEYFLDGTGIDLAVSGPAESVLDELLAAIDPADRSARIRSRRLSDRSGIIGSADPACPDPVYLSVCSRERLTLRFSRGCPRSCRFCSIHLTDGSGYRRVSLEAFAEGLASEPDEHIRIVNFEDDSLLADPCYLKEILGLVRRRFPGVEIRAENGIDPIHLDEAGVDLLASHGMSRLDLSIGSFSASTLAHEYRPNPDRLEQVLHTADTHHMQTTLYWICGLATDTPASVASTLRRLYRLGRRSGISLFYPVPGIPGFTDRSLFRRPLASRAKGSSAFAWTRSLTTRELVTAFRLSRFITLTATADRIVDPIVERTLTTGRLHTRRSDDSGAVVPVEGLSTSLEYDFFAQLGVPPDLQAVPRG